MAEDKAKTPPSPERGRRPRPAPTIDLTATEVGSPPPPPADEPPAAGDGATAATPAKPWYATGAAPQILAGLAGGLLAALILTTVWLLLPGRPAGDAAARTDALERQVRELATKPSAAPDTRALDEFRDRLGRLEQANTSSDPNVGARLTAIENALNASGISLAALSRRIDETAANVASLGKTAAAVDTLQKRIDALETSAKATQDKVAQNTGADTAARLALAAAALREAVRRGEPFAAQLDTARAFGADAASIRLLEPFAATGVPTEAALERELAGLLPAILDASGAASAPGSFVERLQANAGKLVRVRPVNEPAGDDSSAVMERLEIKAAAHDLPAAQAEIAKLPPRARVPAADWSKKMDNRRAALTAADSLVAEAMRVLGRP